MTFVLHVGDALTHGGFDTSAWARWATWCSRKATTILVYFNSTKSQIPEFISDLGLAASSEDFPDPGAALAGLRIKGSPSELKLALQRLPFDPETGVTHLFCFALEKLIANIETDDGPNFLLLSLTESEAGDLVEHLGDLTSSVRICTEWAETIDQTIASGASWKPLGAPGV